MGHTQPRRVRQAVRDFRLNNKVKISIYIYIYIITKTGEQISLNGRKVSDIRLQKPADLRTDGTAVS